MAQRTLSLEKDGMLEILNDNGMLYICGHNVVVGETFTLHPEEETRTPEVELLQMDENETVTFDDEKFITDDTNNTYYLIGSRPSHARTR